MFLGPVLSFHRPKNPPKDTITFSISYKGPRGSEKEHDWIAFLNLIFRTNELITYQCETRKKLTDRIHALVLKKETKEETLRFSIQPSPSEKGLHNFDYLTIKQQKVKELVLRLDVFSKSLEPEMYDTKTYFIKLEKPKRLTSSANYTLLLKCTATSDGVSFKASLKELSAPKESKTKQKIAARKVKSFSKPPLN